MITKENIKLACSAVGINIYWNNLEVTSGMGLNAGINTLGLWTDSSKAEWKILDNREDSLRVKVVFKELPLSQIWAIKILGGSQISITIEVDIEEQLHIDEFRVVCLTNSCYKTWIQDFRQGNFPRPNQNWQGPPLDCIPASLVGVRCPAGGKLLPSLILKHQNDKEQMFSFVQKPPLDIDAHIIGFRRMSLKAGSDYSPGQYHLFSGTVNFLEKENLLDEEIENLRKNNFNMATKERKSTLKTSKKQKVLLANFPWQRQEKWGVRAGSRWPHIKDRSENNYLPFPFFLAYATSLLLENDIDAELIDFIAEATSEDDFLIRIEHMDLDILVVETSIPSFYYDMKMIEKIVSKKQIFIVLCGPHPEIYKPEFLKCNDHIDFVLFGEYEFTLLELVRTVFSKKKDFSSISGLIWRDRENNVIKNCARKPFGLDSLPWPYRGENLPMEKYWDLPGNIPHPSAQMVASRGCPFSCNFCLWPQLMFGNKIYRARDVNDVVNEMEHLINRRGFKSIYFDDDTFNVGKSRMISLCNEIIKRKLNKTPWAIMAKADLMDMEILDKMKEAGLHAVKYGVENASQELVDRCGKNLDLKKAINIIQYTKSLNINVHLTFSFGLPGETSETIRDTIELALKLDPHSVQFSIITPFPGTRLFEELDKKGKILTKDFSMYDGHCSCVFQPDNLSPADLEEAKQFAYRAWADYKRKKRGLRGNIRKFINYWQGHSIGEAIRKTSSYLTYLCFARRKFVGKI